jgi:hypothetical protein
MTNRVILVIKRSTFDFLTLSTTFMCYVQSITNLLWQLKLNDFVVLLLAQAPSKTLVASALM